MEVGWSPFPAHPRPPPPSPEPADRHPSASPRGRVVLPQPVTLRGGQLVNEGSTVDYTRYKSRVVPMPKVPVITLEFIYGKPGDVLPIVGDLFVLKI